MKWRDSEGAKAFLALATTHGCGQCKKKFKDPWVLPTGDPFPHNVKPNAEILFHWEDTHGYPHDMLAEYIFDIISNKGVTT